MKLCLKCKRLNSGSSSVCASGCGGLGGALCGGKGSHFTHGLHVKRCSTCGGAIVTPAVACINLVWVIHAVVWWVVLLVIRYGTHHPYLILVELERAVGWLLGCYVVRLMLSAVNLLLLVWALELILGRKWDDLIPKPGHVRSILAAWWRGLCWLARTLWVLINGSKGGES